MVWLYQLNQLEIILSVKMGNHGPQDAAIDNEDHDNTDDGNNDDEREREREICRERERESSIKNLNENQKVYKLL